MTKQPFGGGDQTLESPADDAPAPRESSRRLGTGSHDAVVDSSGARELASCERGEATPSSALRPTTHCLTPELVDDMLGGMLEPAQRLPAYEHLASCRACIERLTHAGERLLGGGSLAPGRLVARRYRIVRFVAQGGMGEVYEAYDTELSVRVALKLVPAAGEQRPAALRALAREVLLARSIAHPNVCRIFDLGLDETNPTEPPLRFLTMEFVDGERLSTHIASGPMPLGLVCSVARDLLRGLAAAHRAGVLHRDFKSDNVLLREGVAPSPQAVIMDFGLARSLGRSGEHGSVDSHRVEGSLYYMAPEQLLGQALGWETDIYGFGVVLFEMLTGRTPFAEQITLGTAMQRCNAPPPSPAAHVPELLPALDRLVQRCLSPERAARFQSAEAALAALERAFAPASAGGPDRGVPRAPLLIGFMALAGLGLEADELRPRTSELALTPAPPSVAPVFAAVVAAPVAEPALEPEPARAASREADGARRRASSVGSAKPPRELAPPAPKVSTAVAPEEVAAEVPPPAAPAPEEGALLVTEPPLPPASPPTAARPAVLERDRRDTLFDPFLAETAPAAPPLAQD